MQATNIPILLTSSVVVHDKTVSLKNKEERIRLAMQSVEEWLKIDPRLALVLCDGSSFDFSNLVRDYFPLARIECLPFENDQAMVSRFGRGYGEGEIVRHAVRHSKFISDAGCFAKCTSKLWVENFAECTKCWNDSALFKGVFLHCFSLFKSVEFSYIDTRFYIIKTSVYRQYFENAHTQIGKKKGYGLEDCFHHIFIEENIQHALLSVAPAICGVGGGIGTYYKNSVTRRLKEYLRLQVVRRNPAFRNLFV
jgi:hypothetical protein